MAEPFKIKNQAAFQYARAVIDNYTKSFAAASHLLPRPRRWAVYALYGFCRYAYNLIDKPRMRTIDETLSEIESLKQEVMIAYRTGDSEHPVMMSYIEVASHFKIPLEYPLDFLKGVTMEAEQRRYETYEDLYLYCYRMAGIVGLMMAYVLGFKSKAALPYAEKLGVAMHLTNILRDIREDYKSGRIYLPLTEMRKTGVTEEMLARQMMNDSVKSLMERMVQRVHRLYDQAEPGIALLESESRHAIACASRIYRNILYKIEACHYDPFHHHAETSRVEKLNIILREWFVIHIKSKHTENK